MHEDIFHKYEVLQLHLYVLIDEDIFQNKNTMIAGLFTQTLQLKQSLISLTAHHNQEDTERVSAMDELDRSNDNDVQSQKPLGMICYIIGLQITMLL